jgi:radical SAM-linked protein
VGVEIQRGCMRGCRFCQAGYIYRPERQRSPETIRRLVREGLRATGQEEYSLLSLSAGDYNCMEPLLTALMDEHEASRSAISLPSMRLETLSPGIMDQVDRVRKTSFTVAPEAASDRLRAVINKVIDEDVLEGMVGEVFRRGWKSLKFYFMLGIPTEQYEDLQAMVDLGSRCLSAAKRHNRAAGITISVSSFVPKSHTPFQWATQITLPEIEEKQDFLRRELKRAGLGFRWHDARSSVMEGIYSRGDRRSADALLAAYKHGARLDGWQEHFSEEAWQTAFAETGLEPGFYNQRRRDSDEVFPWAHIDCGIEPRWLWEDWMDSLEAGFVPDCTTEPCYDCGVCDHATVHNRVFDRATPGAEPLHRVRKPYQGSRKAEDPQFVAMPRPPGRKGNHVVDAAPPQGMAPGSAPARASRAAHAERVRAAGVTPGKARERVVPHGHEAVRVPGAPRTGAGPGTDWSQVFDTRLPVELRVVVELRYGKLGALAFLGHLEVMAAFRRALKRVSAPVLWTQGFHPQPRFSFGPPLPTGMASVAEHAEIELKRPLDLSVFAEELRRAMPEELPLLDVREVPHGRPSIQDRNEAWVYELRPPAGTGSLELAREAAARFLAAPVCMVSSVRKGEARDVDVRPAVRGLQEQDGAFRVEVAAAGAGARIRDEIEGIFGEAAAQGHGGWQSTRVETLFQAGRGATTA